MSKKKTGEFEMTSDERRLWMEANVAVKLAAHYEQQAQLYREKAARAEFEFWNLIKRTREMPEHCVISVKSDKMLLIVRDKDKHEALLKNQAKRTAIIVDKK